MIVTNTTFRAAPWADVLFAMDKSWWDQHIAEVRRVFKGQLHSTCPSTKQYGIKPVEISGRVFAPFGNSGAGAMILASLAGAKRIIMLGYDCQHTGGKKHWHGDHPPKLGNADRPDAWAKGFAKVAHELQSLEIANCSRETALTMFERKDLRECLEVTD